MKRMVLFTLLCATIVLVCGQDAIALREFEPGITLVDTDELKGMVDRKVDMLLVNTLAPILFRDRAIPGSINLPYENLARGKVLFPADKGRMMVFYCLGFQWVMAPETARLAVEQGYTEVYLYAQGLKGWKKAGYPITSVEKIPNIPVDRLPAARLKVMLREDESLVILDIRDDNLYGKMKFDLPRVIHISSIDLLDRMESIPNDRRIVLSCHKGKLSPKIAPFLKGKGYDIAGILDGGINAWKDMGFSVK